MPYSAEEEWLSSSLPALTSKTGALPVHRGLQMGPFSATGNILSSSKGANRGEYEQGRLD